MTKLQGYSKVPDDYAGPVFLESQVTALEAENNRLSNHTAELRELHATRIAELESAVDLERVRVVMENGKLRLQLAESQAREKGLRKALKWSWSDKYVNGIQARKLAEDALTLPHNDTALKEALKAAKREALLEAAYAWEFEEPKELDVVRFIRRMAEDSGNA